MIPIRKRNRINRRKNQCHHLHVSGERKRTKELMAQRSFQQVTISIKQSDSNYEMSTEAVKTVTHKGLLVDGIINNWIPSQEIRHKERIRQRNSLK